MFYIQMAAKGVESRNEEWNVVLVIMRDGVTVTPLLAPPWMVKTQIVIDPSERRSARWGQDRWTASNGNRGHSNATNPGILDMEVKG